MKKIRDPFSAFRKNIRQQPVKALLPAVQNAEREVSASKAASAFASFLPTAHLPVVPLTERGHSAI